MPADYEFLFCSFCEQYFGYFCWFVLKVVEYVLVNHARIDLLNIQFGLIVSAVLHCLYLHLSATSHFEYS